MEKRLQRHYLYKQYACRCLLLATDCYCVLRYYLGTHMFPDVLLNDIAGPDGNSLLLSLKLSVDVLVSHTVLVSHIL